MYAKVHVRNIYLLSRPVYCDSGGLAPFDAATGCAGCYRACLLAELLEILFTRMFREYPNLNANYRTDHSNTQEALKAQRKRRSISISFAFHSYTPYHLHSFHSLPSPETPHPQPTTLSRAALLLLPLTSLTTDTSPLLRKRNNHAMALPRDFADPSIMLTPDGKYYAHLAGHEVQVATSDDGLTWTYQDGVSTP